MAAQDSESVSSFPFLSHLVFRGFQPNTTAPALDRGFFLCAMSGMLKDVLYWPKRTRIKDDGSEQWYVKKSTIPERQIGSGCVHDGSIYISVDHTPDSNNTGYVEHIDVSDIAWNKSWTAAGVNTQPNLPYNFLQTGK